MDYTFMRVLHKLSFVEFLEETSSSSSGVLLERASSKRSFARHAMEGKFIETDRGGILHILALLSWPRLYFARCTRHLSTDRAQGRCLSGSVLARYAPSCKRILNRGRSACDENPSKFPAWIYEIAGGQTGLNRENWLRECRLRDS